MIVLSDFSRRNEEAEEDAQMRAVSGAAAPVPAPQMRAAGGAAEPVFAHIIAEAQAEAYAVERIRAAAEAQAIERRIRAAAEAQARAIQMRAAAQVPAPPMRAGGGAAAPPRRRRQYDSDSDGGYGYIRRYGS
jgi:hypothetical protein